MDKAFNFLGMCKKAGALLTGEDGVGGAARQGKAALIMTASDTAHNTLKKAENLAQWNNAVLVSLPWNKDALGELLGKRVCAILAITDKGLASAFAEKLAAQDPLYGETVKALKEKSTRRGREFNDKIQNS